MQYHWIALVVLMVFLKKIKFGLIVNAAVILGSILLTAVIIFIYDFPPGRVQTGRE